MGRRRILACRIDGVALVDTPRAFGAVGSFATIARRQEVVVNGAIREEVNVDRVNKLGQTTMKTITVEGAAYIYACVCFVCDMGVMLNIF